MLRLQKLSSIIMLVVIIVCLLHFSFVANAEISNLADDWRPEKKDLESSLRTVMKISNITHPAAKEILQIYKAEKVIGKCVWYMTTEPITEQQMIKHFNCSADTKVITDIVRYIRTNQARFQVVDDGFKEEYNFCEPNRYWLDRIKKTFPDSLERTEIEFDLDFNEFIRQYDIDEDAKGQSCEQYVKKSWKEGQDAYREAGYSVEGWIPECKQVRKNFQTGRKKLLKKYQNSPFIKKLQNIDKTTIVVFHHVC